MGIIFTHNDNTFHSHSEILKEKNDHSAVFHPNDGTFWNRNQMYDTLKIDEFYDKEFYDVNEENSIGWGLKDKPFFEQSIDRKSTRLNSSHVAISYAVFCLKKKNKLRR